MKTLRFLILLPLIGAQPLLGQTTTSPVSPDSTSGTTTVNFTGANANKGAGEDTSAGGTGGRISIGPQAAASGNTSTAADGSTGIVTSGATSVPAANTNTTTISGTTTGTNTTTPSNAATGATGVGEVK